MDKAPTIAELSAVPMVRSKVKQPSISLIGCGGCGINLLSNFAAAGYHFHQPIAMYAYDTSKANWESREQPDNIKFELIGGGDGSGKDRSRNVEPITKFLDTHKSIIEKATDITILLVGLGGGSGSVIAPLLAHRLLRHSERAVVVVAVGNQSSDIDAANTTKTLKSFSALAVDNKYYIPLLLFENWSSGRRKTDQTIQYRLHALVDMLTNTSISEIDFEDKMRFLRPTRIGCPAGCYLMSISPNDPDNDEDLPGETINSISEGDMVHAAMVVNDSGLTPDINTKVSYVGISDDVKFFSTVGMLIPKTYVDKLNDVNERYARARVDIDTTRESLEGVPETSDRSGLIL